MGGGAAADPHRHGPQPRCPDHLQPLQARGPIAVEKRRADPMPESTAVAPSEPQADGAVGFSPPAAVRADRRAKTIETTALNLFYGDLQAVENVTMTIEPNKVTALIGSSGCGKTTFLRSLNRMHELTPGARVQGEVTLDGEDIYDARLDPRAARRRGERRGRGGAFDGVGLSAADPVPDDVDLRHRRRRADAEREAHLQGA